MRKSGLQKQIAFIFNDVPMPEQEPKSLNLPTRQQTDTNSAPDTQDTTLSEQQQTPQTTAAVQAEAVHTPSVSALRPKPLPRLQTAAKSRQKTTKIVTRQVKKALYGSENQTMDPRQKKMTVLVSVLAVVFAGVLIMTLGGVGEKKNQNTDAEMSGTAPLETVQAQQLKQWQIPEPLPAQMRDPMNPQKSKPESSLTGQQAGQWVVRGIVFSQTNPSAIVNDQIIRPGQTINGATVTAIHKDSVEFEQGDKRWTQPVQR